LKSGSVTNREIHTNPTGPYLETTVQIGLMPITSDDAPLVSLPNQLLN